MNRLYPMKFIPLFKDKIWGGQKMNTMLGLDFFPLPNCGEAWMLSGVENNYSVVSNGFLAGNELPELTEIYMDDLMGGHVFDRFGTHFPILIKFIDSNDYLSIQVHPGEILARKRKVGDGKSELWYILQADENAEVINGFRGNAGKETYLKHLSDKSLTEILNAVTVKADDVLHIPAGRIHALGPGILLAEIQQTSDVTYRIYDWDRLDHKGQPREMHTELALDAIDFTPCGDSKTHYSQKLNRTSNILSNHWCTTNLIHIDQPVVKNYSELDSFVIYVCVRGTAGLSYHHETMKIQQGDVILIPAELNEIRLFPQMETRILEVFIL